MEIVPPGLPLPQEIQRALFSFLPHHKGGRETHQVEAKAHLSPARIQNLATMYNAFWHVLMNLDYFFHLPFSRDVEAGERTSPCCRLLQKLFFEEESGFKCNGGKIWIRNENCRWKANRVALADEFEISQRSITEEYSHQFLELMKWSEASFKMTLFSERTNSEHFPLPVASFSYYVYNTFEPIKGFISKLT